MFSSNQSNVAAVAANYIEDVFSTYLYDGTGAAQTITNNIDLSTKGGLVWLKGRSGATGYRLTDTARGVTKSLASETTAAEATETTGLTAFGTTGFTIGADADYNTSAATYASWTFRKQPKMFDIQTWTGSGANRTIAHSLGSVPGCIIVKRTDTTADWAVYHRSLANTDYLTLNTTAAAATGATRWNSTTATSAVFSLGTDATVNASGGTYVAYIFAHDAGGFGLAGTDNVISCGSYTGTSAVGNAQTLGYEPQWILIKRNTASYDWTLIDTMRGWATNGADAELYADSSSAEYFADNLIDVTATGFNFSGSATALNASGATYIYIACRRGPMKVPTLGTSVYTGSLAAGSVSVSAGFVPDLAFVGKRDTSGGVYAGSRLQGSSVYLNTYNSAVEAAFGWVWDSPTKTWMQTSIGADVVNWLFARAPSVCDVVCYTGSGSNTTKNHNLGVVPELIILKGRDAATPWACYSASLANTDYLVLRTTAASATDATYWNSTTPTSSVFSIGTNANVNTSAATYVAYLFATLAGVSKVGSYTGNGTTQTINCGFTGGARWVMIKRTDSTGSWYVYDTARGMTVLTDPYLLMNSNAAEVATLGSVTTVSTGFALDSTILAAINISAGTYIFLAIA